jgi:hypothetical protein
MLDMLANDGVLVQVLGMGGRKEEGRAQFCSVPPACSLHPPPHTLTGLLASYKTLRPVVVLLDRAFRTIA